MTEPIKPAKALDFDHMRALTERECTCGGRGGDHPEACNACKMYHGFNAAEKAIKRLEDIIAGVSCDEATIADCERYCSHGNDKLHAESRAIRARVASHA